MQSILPHFPRQPQSRRHSMARWRTSDIDALLYKREIWWIGPQQIEAFAQWKGSCEDPVNQEKIDLKVTYLPDASHPETVKNPYKSCMKSTGNTKQETSKGMRDIGCICIVSHITCESTSGNWMYTLCQSVNIMTLALTSKTFPLLQE